MATLAISQVLGEATGCGPGQRWFRQAACDFGEGIVVLARSTGRHQDAEKRPQTQRPSRTRKGKKVNAGGWQCYGIAVDGQTEEWMPDLKSSCYSDLARCC